MSIKSLFDILKVVTTFGIVDNLFNVGFIRELFLFFFLHVSFSSSSAATFETSFSLRPLLTLSHCRSHFPQNSVASSPPPLSLLHYTIASALALIIIVRIALSLSLTRAAQLSLWDSEATSAKLNISATFFLLCAPTSINTQTFLL